jgi:hypothetical protein
MRRRMIKMHCDNEDPQGALLALARCAPLCMQRWGLVEMSGLLFMQPNHTNSCVLVGVSSGSTTRPELRSTPEYLDTKQGSYR